MSKDKPRYVFARATTLVFAPERLRITAGTTWHADHPVVASHPDLFSEDPPEILPRNWEAPAKPEPKVEQATAAPGEKRTARRGG